MVSQAVFLDRDGTIAEDVGYCCSPDDFKLFPGTVKAIRMLNKNDFKVILITNQSGIGRGYFTEETLTRIHDKMMEDFARLKVHVDDIYYCPHHPDDNCDCRKPKPKLVLQAAREHDIDLKRSFVIGDQMKDVELGKAVGCKTILIQAQPPRNESVTPDAVVPDLLEAARVILELDNKSRNRYSGLSA